jgi:hypothetical protein
MFVGQRPQMINALRGHLAEHGLFGNRTIDTAAYAA